MKESEPEPIKEQEIQPPPTEIQKIALQRISFLDKLRAGTDIKPSVESEVPPEPELLKFFADIPLDILSSLDL